ncbi:hypothetical protein ACTFIW_009928 [Dictyostelium discoideum]
MDINIEESIRIIQQGDYFNGIPLIVDRPDSLLVIYPNVCEVVNGNQLIQLHVRKVSMIVNAHFKRHAIKNKGMPNTIVVMKSEIRQNIQPVHGNNYNGGFDPNNWGSISNNNHHQNNNNTNNNNTKSEIY